MQLTIQSPIPPRLGRIFYRSLAAVALIGALAASGCGGTDYNDGYGNAFVTYSDTPGDFSNYNVVVSSVTLTRSDGAVVSGVGASEQADLAQLGDRAEMVGSTSVPIGTYTSATIAMDYTAASGYINVAGVPKPVKFVDATGAALTTVSIVVTFDPANPLVIAQSQAQRLNIDFNLAASSRINLATSPIQVITTPYITASNDPHSTKPIRVRGALISYNSVVSSYTVYVRPFLDEVNNLGAVTLFSSPTTTYAIDNLSFTGPAGIETITNLGTGSITMAYTTYAPDSKAGVFTLTDAYIATANESLVADRLEGTVVARSGNTLTIRGATLGLRTGTFSYSPANATVTVANATVVSIDGQPTAPANIGAVSVGQHVVVLGQATVTSAGVVSMNATAGRLRLSPTRVWGSLTTASAGSAALQLQAIGEWPVSVFNFAGTGATPASYLLNTGSADDAAAVGTPVAADGFVTPFGTSPPDFSASAVSATTAINNQLIMEWVAGGTTAPFSSVSSTTLVPNLADPKLDGVHTVGTGPFSTDLKTLPSSPSIVADTTVRGDFAVGSAAAGVAVFSKFSDFVAKINSSLSAAKPVARLVATGRYDATTNIFTASSVHVVLN